MAQPVLAQLSPIGIIALALEAIFVVLTMETLPECIQRDKVTPTVSCNTNSASSRAVIDVHIFLAFIVSSAFRVQR